MSSQFLTLPQPLNQLLYQKQHYTLLQMYLIRSLFHNQYPYYEPFPCSEDAPEIYRGAAILSRKLLLALPVSTILDPWLNDLHLRHTRAAEVAQLFISEHLNYI